MLSDQQGMAEDSGELNTSWMNKQHQDFYSKNPHHKDTSKGHTDVGGRLATKVTPTNKPAQVTKKPITSFESADNTEKDSGTALQGQYGHSGKLNPVAENTDFLDRLRELSGMSRH
jgi:hypothetical protein